MFDGFANILLQTERLNRKIVSTLTLRLTNFPAACLPKRNLLP
jgi:hypothetical protein